MADKTPVKPVEKAAAPPQSSCPDHPYEFFSIITVWAATAAKWAADVDDCYTSQFPDKAELGLLCNQFESFAEQAKHWGDAVDAKCAHTTRGRGSNKDHTGFPTPPFGDGSRSRDTDGDS